MEVAAQNKQLNGATDFIFLYIMYNATILYILTPTVYFL